MSTTPPRRHHRQPARKPPPIIRHPRPHQPTSKTTARPTIGSPATPPHFKNSIFQRDVAAPITIPTKTPTLAQKPSQKPPTARSPFPLPPRRPQSPSLRPKSRRKTPSCTQNAIKAESPLNAAISAKPDNPPPNTEYRQRYIRRRQPPLRAAGGIPSPNSPLSPLLKYQSHPSRHTTTFPDARRNRHRDFPTRPLPRDSRRPVLPQLEITPEIIFAAIISDSRTRTAAILKTFGITAENYQPSRRHKRQTVPPSFSQPARHTLNAAIQLARKQGFEKATTQHYITAIFTDPPRRLHRLHKIRPGFPQPGARRLPPTPRRALIWSQISLSTNVHPQQRPQAHSCRTGPPYVPRFSRMLRRVHPIVLRFLFQTHLGSGARIYTLDNLNSSTPFRTPTPA